jgi:hypothetical protein
VLSDYLGEKGGAMVRGSRCPMRLGYAAKTLTSGRLRSTVVSGVWIEIFWL